MNKFMFAYVAFVAIAANCVSAKPSNYGAAVPSSVSYHAIPVSAVSPVYSSPSNSYGAHNPSVAYNAPVALLQPIAVQASHGKYAAPSVPSILTAAASHPVAQSSASTSVAGLSPGQYTQLVIPSYEILAGEKLNLVGGQANIGASYGGHAAQTAY